MRGRLASASLKKRPISDFWSRPRKFCAAARQRQQWNVKFSIFSRRRPFFLFPLTINLDGFREKRFANSIHLLRQLAAAFGQYRKRFRQCGQRRRISRGFGCCFRGNHGIESRHQSSPLVRNERALICSLNQIVGNVHWLQGLLADKTGCSGAGLDAPIAQVNTQFFIVESLGAFGRARAVPSVATELRAFGVDTPPPIATTDNRI
jgi:hypothetical protein